MSARRVNEKLILIETTDSSVVQPPTVAIDRFFSSRIRISQIRMLVAIDDLKQLKKVAQLMNVTPPAISKQLAEIEDALGQKVLQRVGSRLEFTEVGAVLARHARTIIEQLARTRMEVDQLCAGVASKVGLGAVPTVAPFFLPALVNELKQRSPGSEIKLKEAQFDRLAPLLDDKTLDVVLAR
ncbi:LysR family transcriptional regulator, partial [bacterium]